MWTRKNGVCQRIWFTIKQNNFTLCKYIYQRTYPKTSKWLFITQVGRKRWSTNRGPFRHLSIFYEGQPEVHSHTLWNDKKILTVSKIINFTMRFPRKNIIREQIIYHCSEWIIWKRADKPLNYYSVSDTYLTSTMIDRQL